MSTIRGLVCRGKQPVANKHVEGVHDVGERGVRVRYDGTTVQQSRNH